MSLRLSGINPLAYSGVEPLTPPQFEIHDRAPTANDYISFNVGTIWLHKRTGVIPTAEDIYVLVSKDAQVATWVNLRSGSTGTTSIMTVRAGQLNVTSSIIYHAPGDNTTSGGTLDQVQCVIPLNGRIDRLYVRIYENLCTIDSSITLNINGSNTSLTTSTPALTTGIFSDLINSVNVLQGDLLAFEASQGATNVTRGFISFRFTAL